MRYFFRIWIWLLLFFPGGMLYTQVLKGRVIDSKTRRPIPFASVVGGNNSNGCVTGIDGYFVLQLMSKDSIRIVSATGIKTHTFIHITFDTDTFDLGDVPVIFSGYDENVMIKKGNKTVCVYRDYRRIIKEKDLKVKCRSGVYYEWKTVNYERFFIDFNTIRFCDQKK